jgi:hypothetical protein
VHGKKRKHPKAYSGEYRQRVIEMMKATGKKIIEKPDQNNQRIKDGQSRMAKIQTKLHIKSQSIHQYNSNYFKDQLYIQKQNEKYQQLPVNCIEFIYCLFKVFFSDQGFYVLKSNYCTPDVSSNLNVVNRRVVACL